MDNLTFDIEDSSEGNLEKLLVKMSSLYKSNTKDDVQKLNYLQRCLFYIFFKKIYDTEPESRDQIDLEEIRSKAFDTANTSVDELMSIIAHLTGNTDSLTVSITPNFV